MPLRFVVNGKIVDDGESPNQEATDAPAQGADGRTLLDNTSAVYRVDGSVDKITSRSFNKDIALPTSANYTKVMPVKTTEAFENPIVASVKAAQAVNDASLRLAQDARDAETNRVIAKANADDAAIASATNLVQTSGVPGTYNGTWVVKPTKS